jgi:outer membrane receptor protein involved in Fe transport
LLGSLGAAPVKSDASADADQSPPPPVKSDSKVADAQINSQLQEILVTATRRTEKLQDVPLSVTAYSQEQLTENGIVGYEGLALQTPGVVLNKQSDNFNNLTARGIATNSYGANLQSTVAIYIDELPITTIGNTTTLNPNLFDVERVEFLRGPQGTLFGSGSLSGALRILTKSPNLTAFEASTQVDYGFTGSGWDSLRQRYDGMVNIPLVNDQLALRIVGFYRHEDGWIDNVGTGTEDSNTLEDGGMRATLMYKPTERLSAKFLISYEDSYPKDASLTQPSLGTYVRDSNQPDIYSGIMTNYNATIDYQFDGASLTSSSTYSIFNQRFLVDLAGTFDGAIAFGLDALGYQRTFVQETRLASDPGGKFDWVIGAFYLHRHLGVDYGYRSSDSFLASHDITGLPNEYYSAEVTHSVSDEVAGFGDLTYHISDQFWVTGGLRYTSDSATTDTEPGGYTSNYFANALGGVTGPLDVTPIPSSVSPAAKETKPSYKASISYKPFNSLTSYATFSTGFRAPVVNAFAGQASVVNPHDIIIPSGATSDNLKNYEIGVKSNWLDNRLSANVAAYYIDWTNIQVQANRVSDSVQFATNIGGAHSKGIELELQAVPISGLTIGLNGSYDNARVTSLTAEQAAISGAVLGARLSAPEIQGALNGDYAFDLTSNVKANVTASLQHVGKFPNAFPDVAGEPGVRLAQYAYTDTFNTVNTQFRVAIDRNLKLALYCENVFDSAAITYIHPEAFIASRYGRLQPRTTGIRVGYDF